MRERSDAGDYVVGRIRELWDFLGQVGGGEGGVEIRFAGYVEHFGGEVAAGEILEAGGVQSGAREAGAAACVEDALRGGGGIFGEVREDGVGDVSGCDVVLGGDVGVEVGGPGVVGALDFGGGGGVVEGGYVRVAAGGGCYGGGHGGEIV